MRRTADTPWLSWHQAGNCGENARARGEACPFCVTRDTDPEVDYEIAVTLREDRWVAACNGLERPFEYLGTRWQYVFNPATRCHGYLNLDTDIVSDDYRSDR